MQPVMSMSIAQELFAPLLYNSKEFLKIDVGQVIY